MLETDLLIFGNGWLGHKIRDYFDSEGNKTFLSAIDIANPDKVRDILRMNKPKIVINAAGKTGKPTIDWCNENDENRLATIRSNVAGPLVLLDQCTKLGIRLVHLSSGCIFTGDAPRPSGFNEDDQANPNSFYAETKTVADAILEQFHRILIIRIRKPIDDDVHPRNLIYKLSHYPRVANLMDSVTVVPHMLYAIKILMRNEMEGIFNVVNPTPVTNGDIMTWYQEIVDPNHKYELVAPEEIKNLAKDGRSVCVLNTDKLNRAGIYLAPAPVAIQDCLRRYAKNFKDCNYEM
jgi:3,5-epimerase/4-reductase